MKRFRTAIVASAFLFALGCDAPHSIKLMDGTIIESENEPQFEKTSGFYIFKTENGGKMKLNKDEIRSIRSTLAFQTVD